MALHFTPAEFARRRETLLAAMQAERLDALFLFQQESMFWLSGYDTFGFCFFQCLVVKADGTTTDAVSGVGSEKYMSTITRT